MRLLQPSLAFALALALPAQNVFHGNGIPSAYLDNTPAVVGRSLTFHLGSPTAPNSLGVIAISGGLGPFFVPHPLVGYVGIDPTNPFFLTVLMFLDANGDSGLSIALPPGLGNASTPPFFATGYTLEAGPLFSFAKTVRVEWADPDGWKSPATLGTARQLHTATALGTGPRDNTTEVLFCGGATGSLIVPTPVASAELFDPLTRTFQPLPNLSLPRSCHRAVRLLDGRVLVTGGVTTGGVVTATCEFFDPLTATFVAAPSMTAPRAGHALTVLADGRVLASGGVQNWQNAATNFIAVLNSSLSTAEIFDPATNVWSLLPLMSSRRLGHSQTLLLDGRVLVAGGIAGGFTGTNPLASNGSGQVPYYAATCEVFDPATSTFTPTAGLGLAFHGASLLPNGNVLVTGGFVPNVNVGWSPNGEAIPSAACLVWNGAVWNAVAPLPVAVACHTQVPFRNGALISGGFIGDLTALLTSSQNLLHDGTTVTSLAPIPGTRAEHTATVLHDGSVLLYGGGQWPNTLADATVYTGN